jgi:hypothetical protein
MAGAVDSEAKLGGEPERRFQEKYASRPALDSGFALKGDISINRSIEGQFDFTGRPT